MLRLIFVNRRCFFFLYCSCNNIKRSNIGIHRDYRLELYPRLFEKRREDPSFLPFPYATPIVVLWRTQARKRGKLLFGGRGSLR